jgi:hypothetical protein
MNIDIATTVKVVIIFLGLGLLISLIYGYRSIRLGLHLEFFRKRRDLISHGWNLIFFAILLGGVAWLIYRFGEPVAYRYFPPSPTATSTPTVTLTPTITPTLKDTLTPTITETLQYTYTPEFPLVLQQTVQTPIGPDTSSVFSPIQFSSKLNKNGIVKDNITTTFPANVAHIYGGYSFDQMALGVQWSAIWLLDGTKPVHIQTNVWKLASGGYGDTDWDCTTGECVPGAYVVQIFVGSSFKTYGRFTITGTAITGTVTPTPTLGLSKPTATPTPTLVQ